MSARKDARQVIRTHILDAVADLGGKSQGEPIKQWILNKVGAKVEDFGRTPPNKKYPNGRFVFVEAYTHIQRDMKKQGHLFTPAWGWVSLTDGETVEVDGKVLSKPKKTAESTRKVKSEATKSVQTPTETLSTPQQEEEVVEEVQVARVEPENLDTTSLSAESYVEEREVEVESEPTLLEKVLELTEDHYVSVENKAVKNAWVNVSQKVLVLETVGGKLRKALDELEDGDILSIDEVREQEPAFKVEPFGSEVSAEVDPSTDLRVGVDKDGVEIERHSEALPEEYNTPIKKESLSESYTLPPVDALIEVEKSDNRTQEYNLESKNDLYDDDDLYEEEDGEDANLDDALNDLELGLGDEETQEEEEEQEEEDGLKFLLENIKADIWAEMKDKIIYLADSENPTELLKFDTTLTGPIFAKEEKRKNCVSAMQQLRDSKTKINDFVEKISSVVDKLDSASKSANPNLHEKFSEHYKSGRVIGCFGAKVANKHCQEICSVATYCDNAELIQI